MRRTTCQRWDCEPCRQSTADSWTGLLEAARLSSAAVRGFLRALMGCEGCQGLSPCSPGTALVGDSLGTAPCRRLCCKFAAGLLRPRPSGGKPRPGCTSRRWRGRQRCARTPRRQQTCSRVIRTVFAYAGPASPPGIVVYTVIYALHRSKYTCVNGVYAVWVCLSLIHI